MGTVNQRQTENGWTLTIRINRNRKHCLGTVSNKLLGQGEGWGAGGEGVNRFYTQQPHPWSCCGSYTHRSCSVRVKDLYSSMNQNSKHINRFISHHWDETNKTSTQQQTNSETLEQQKSNSWTLVGPTKDRSSGPSQLNWKLYAGAIIKSEVWKVVNHDWVNHKACSLSHNIHVLSDSFVTKIGLSCRGSGSQH